VASLEDDKIKASGHCEGEAHAATQARPSAAMSANPILSCGRSQLIFTRDASIS
jgi:hypothetical protein